MNKTKSIEGWSKKHPLRPANVALIAAVGILMGMIALVVFRVS